MEGMENLIILERAADAGDASPEAPTRLRPGPSIGSLLARLGREIGSAIDWLFGLFSLVLGLSILAALPLAQLLSLGYFLESSARVARTGRLRDGLIGVRRAARLGGVVLGTMLSLLPLWLAGSYAQSASLIDPGGRVAQGWRAVLGIVAVLTFLQILTACARGGRLRHFFWPVGIPSWFVRGLRAGGLYAGARDGFWDFAAALRLPYYFRLGLVGFLGTLAWLIVPASLIAASGRYPVLGF